MNLASDIVPKSSGQIPIEELLIEQVGRIGRVRSAGKISDRGASARRCQYQTSSMPCSFTSPLAETDPVNSFLGLPHIQLHTDALGLG